MDRTNIQVTVDFPVSLDHEKRLHLTFVVGDVQMVRPIAPPQSEDDLRRHPLYNRLMDEINAMVGRVFGEHAQMGMAIAVETPAGSTVDLPSLHRACDNLPPLRLADAAGAQLDRLAEDLAPSQEDKAEEHRQGGNARFWPDAEMRLGTYDPQPWRIGEDPR